MCWSKCNSRAITACSSENTWMREMWSSNEQATEYFWLCPLKATTVPLKFQWDAEEQLTLCLGLEDCAGWSCVCRRSESAAALAAEHGGRFTRIAAGTKAPPVPPYCESLSLCSPSAFGSSACRVNTHRGSQWQTLQKVLCQYLC